MNDIPNDPPIIRPIDRLRNSGASMKLGADGEDGEIDSMCEISGSLHMIMTRAIYMTKLADEIDPKRTNINIPNVNQKVLSVGTESPIVRRILIQGKRLFADNLFGSEFNYKGAIGLTFEALKDLVGMDTMRAELVAKLEKISEEAKILSIDKAKRSLAVPHVGDVQGLTEGFLQKADHAAMDLFKIVRLFYGEELEKGRFKALQRVVKEKYKDGNPFSEFLDQVVPILLFVRNARNAVEHPDNFKRVIVKDISLSEDGQLVPPQIEVVHPELPATTGTLVAFMTQITEGLINTFEVMMTYLGACHVQPQGGLPLEIIELTPDQQKIHKCRYGYGVLMGGQLCLFG